MATIYKIHPAIGVARVGNSPDAFFIGPETPGSPGVEIGADGAETTLTTYKHNGLVKRQATRFRVLPTSKTCQATSNWSVRSAPTRVSSGA